MTNRAVKPGQMWVYHSSFRGDIHYAIIEPLWGGWRLFCLKDACYGWETEANFRTISKWSLLDEEFTKESD